MSGVLKRSDESDVIGHIRHDHGLVQEMMGKFEMIGRDEWAGHFRDLVRLLVSHEVAEEEVIFPVVRRQSEAAGGVADSCIGEQQEAERRLEKMERLDATTVEFRDEFELLRSEVLAHAAHEEREVLPLLEALTEHDREMLASRYERARSIAPTHPHPHAPDSPPGNVVLGPVVALADRLRDAVRREP